MCLYPRLIRNPKYQANTKNGGQVPPVLDNRTLYVPIGCNNCMECRKQKCNNWRVRLMEDIKMNKNAHFITLTFSNEKYTEIDNKCPKEIEGYDRDNWIATYAVRHFLENWRKQFKKSLRHWFVTELGHRGTENIHIHGIVWTHNKEAIKKKWNYGYSWIGTYVNEKTINYIAKYITKIDPLHKYYKSLVLTSPGIGSNYTKTLNSKLNKYKPGNTNDLYTGKTGHKLPLPIYYRNKIYTDEEREKLWLEKLDKEERYVNGTRIDVSKNFYEYMIAKEYARKINKRYGYGSNEKDWNRMEYEKQIRIIKQLKRKNNNNNNK